MRSVESDQTGRLHAKVGPNLTSTGIDFKYGCRLHTEVAPYFCFYWSRLQMLLWTAC